MEGTQFWHVLWLVIVAAFCGLLPTSEAACPAHPLTANATWTENGVATGNTGNYSCVPGFSFNNSVALSQIFTCGAGGDWSPDPIDFQCSALPCTGALMTYHSSADGAVGAVAGDVVTISCDTGYVFNDSSIRKHSTCTEGLFWDPPALSCEAVECPPIFNESFNNASTRDHWYPVTVNYTCWPDYYFPDGALWRVVSCDQYGRWTEVIPPCTDEVPNNVVETVILREEAKDALSFATIAMIIIGVIVLAIIILDAATFSRQLMYMKENLQTRWPNMCTFSSKGEEDDQGSLDDLHGSGLAKSTISLGRGKVTPAPSTVDLHEPPPYEVQDPMFGAIGGAMAADGGTPPLPSKTDDIEVINELDIEEMEVVDTVPPPPAPATSAPPSAHRTRLKSARTSIQRALQMVNTTVRLKNGGKRNFTEKTLPLGEDNIGKTPAEKRPVSPLKEEYDSEPSEEGEETEDDDEEETEA